MSVTCYFLFHLLANLSISKNNNKNEPPQLPVNQGGRNKNISKQESKQTVRTETQTKGICSPTPTSHKHPAFLQSYRFSSRDVAILALFFPKFWQYPSLQAAKPLAESKPEKTEKLFCLSSFCHSITNLFFPK